MIGNIGETAGKVYNYIDSEGEVTLASLKKNLNLKGDLVPLSIGWLAREGKLEINRRGNSTRLSLIN